MATNVGDSIPEELRFFPDLVNEWGWHVDKSLCHNRSRRNSGGGYVFVLKGYGYRRHVIFQGMDVYSENPAAKYDLADPKCFSKMKGDFDEFVKSTGGTIGSGGNS